MSHASTVWAQRQQIGAGDSPTGKFVPSLLKWLLVALADYEQGTGEVFGSIIALSCKTEMDRKTVQAYLQELVRRGFIQDTGKRVGRTKQVPVYQLIGFDADIAFATRQARQRLQGNDPARGTVSRGAGSPASFASQVDESTDEFGTDDAVATGSGQTVPRAGSLSAEAIPPAGTVPPAGHVPPGSANDPAGDTKRSRARDTERVLNGSIEPPDAGAHARGRARPRGVEPEPEQKLLTADQVVGHWRGAIRADVESILWLELPTLRRRPLDRMPDAVQSIAKDPLEHLAQHFATLELREGRRSRAMIDDATRAAQVEAGVIAAMYRRSAAA